MQGDSCDNAIWSDDYSLVDRVWFSRGRLFSQKWGGNTVVVKLSPESRAMLARVILQITDEELAALAGSENVELRHLHTKLTRGNS